MFNQKGKVTFGNEMVQAIFKPSNGTPKALQEEIDKVKITILETNDNLAKL